jgi:hypothetical protein
LTNGAPLETIQSVLDDILPGCGDVYNEFDNSMIEYSNMKMNVWGWLKFGLDKFVSILKPRKTLRPVLRTTSAPPRQTTTRQALLALNKRNLGANHVSSPLGYKNFAEKAFENMMDVFAVEDWRERLKRMDKIIPTETSLAEWSEFQNKSTIKAMQGFDCNVVLEEVKEKIADYEFILKASAKAATDLKPITAYPTVQTVMFHKKQVNAFFGPMIREADIRFRSLLRHDVLYNKGKNLESIEQFLTVCYKQSGGNVIVENDFTDYDRSQEEVAYSLDGVMLKWLGLNPDDLETWMAGHYKHSNINYALALVVYLRYQRKSGDVTTAFGNTVLNMTALAWSLKLERGEVLAAMFLGDDSWFQLIDSPSMRVRIKGCSDEIAINFNGDAKTAYYDVGYFCGNYILDVESKVCLAADPIKRAVKLGRWDVKDKSMIIENWISFGDLMRNYNNESVQEKLAHAVAERHPKATYNSAKLLIEALNSMRASYKEFSRLWDSVVSKTEY